jgi:hypothetical protein
MTKLKDQKAPTVRETDAYERSSALIVSLHPRYLTVRLKGAREALDVPYGAILDLGRKMAYKRKAS